MKNVTDEQKGHETKMNTIAVRDLREVDRWNVYYMVWDTDIESLRTDGYTVVVLETITADEEQGVN